MSDISELQQLIDELGLDKAAHEKASDLLKKIDHRIKHIEFINKHIFDDKKTITDFLNTTVKELEKANNELKGYQEQILEEKEQELKFKEIQLEQIVNAMPFTLAFIDTNFKYQINNRAYQERFGFEENLKGKSIKEVWGERYETVHHITSKTISQKKEQEMFNNFLDKNGNERIFRNYVFPAFDNNSNVIGAYVFGEDLTEIKAKEKLIEDQNTELKKYIESNMQLENFAYLASHDLRSPLVNVINFANLLEESAISKLTDEEKQFLKFIKGSSLRMEAFIRDLLNFSVIENHILKATSVNLMDLIDEIIFDLDAKIVESKAEILINNLNHNIVADRFLLKSLFQNLISNAIKFVKINTIPQIEISHQERKKSFLISVKDNGIGISKEYIDQIFVIFKRLNRQKDYAGTGIGLSICKSAIKKIGGNIWIEQNDSGGSTFFVEINKK